MFRAILFLLIFLSPLTPAQASDFVKCTSANLDLTFEINSLFKTVRNVDYNTKMSVGYWSEEAINTEFSINKSLSQIVRGAVETENVSINFDRLNGSISVAGINSPTQERIESCKKNSGFGCDAWVVEALYGANCSVVKKKF